MRECEEGEVFLVQKDTWDKWLIKRGWNYFTVDKSAGALSSMNIATTRLKWDSLWTGWLH